MSYISFILPAFIIYIGIIIFPVLFSFYLSLTKWKGYGKMEFIGLGNYIRMFTDPVFYIGLRNNILIVLIKITFASIGAIRRVKIIPSRAPSS